MIGKTLSHYRIVEKIGAGGMGEVYIAEDAKLHRKLVLKILPAEMASEERRHGFEREISRKKKEIAARVDSHENINSFFSIS